LGNLNGRKKGGKPKGHYRRLSQCNSMTPFYPIGTKGEGKEKTGRMLMDL